MHYTFDSHYLILFEIQWLSTNFREQTSGMLSGIMTRKELFYPNSFIIARVPVEFQITVTPDSHRGQQKRVEDVV